jgi:hypothetical protein
MAAFPSPLGGVQNSRAALRTRLCPAPNVDVATKFSAPVFFKCVRKPRGRLPLLPEGDSLQRRAFCEVLCEIPEGQLRGSSDATDAYGGTRAGSMDIRGDGEHMAVKLLECEPAADHNQYE